MLFRYKIEEKRDTLYTAYLVIIQRYYENVKFFPWRTIEEVSLRHITNTIHEGCYADKGINFLFQITPQMLYDELQRYESMDDLMMEYLKSEKFSNVDSNVTHQKYEKLLKKLVLNKDWKTLEVKENED